MASEGSQLLAMIRDSVATPEAAAARLLSLRPTPAILLQAAVLVSALDALLLGTLTGGGFAIPLPEGEWILPPLLHAALLVGSLVLTAGALQVGGRLLGGQGTFAQALLVAIWLEVVAIAVQVAQLALSFLLPMLADLLGLLGVGVVLWCMVHFTRVLHGFPGFGRAIGAILLGALAVGLALSLLLGLLGFGATPDV